MKPREYAKQVGSIDSGVCRTLDRAGISSRPGRRDMSPIRRAYKTELDLNTQQVTTCKKHAGAPRWAYNWGLQRKQEVYRQTGTSPSAIELHREPNALK